MKKFSQSILIFLVLSLSGSYQDARAQTIRQWSESIVNEVNNSVENFLMSGLLDEATKEIEWGYMRCEEIGNPDLCVGGMNFTSGYFYQRAALQDNENAESLIEKAKLAYEQVLSIYPDNKAAWSNLIKVKEMGGVNESAISQMEELAYKYPAQKVDYLVRIGNLYKDEESLSQACNYYQKAYDENPFSEKACGAMVALYTQYDYGCGPLNDIRQFALHCYEIDLANYSEELLRVEMDRAFKMNDREKAYKSMILWANLMAEMGWLLPEKVERMHRTFFPESTGRDLKSYPLKELQILLESKDMAELTSLQFWESPEPEISFGQTWIKISPLSVRIKILRARGQKALVQGNLEFAEKILKEALIRARYVDKAYFTLLASDLAQLYNTDPNMDPRGQKMDDLVILLFEGKGTAYNEEDMALIRNYHITLGGIFYDREVWGGSGAANARFQLSRALSNRFGPITNPKLRSMLGDVYQKLGEEDRAISSYILSVQDYLSLDQVKEAENMMRSIRVSFPDRKIGSRIPQWDNLNQIIQMRKTFARPDKPLLDTVLQIPEWAEHQITSMAGTRRGLPSEFINIQFFKGLADLAIQLPANKRKEKQVLFSAALGKIENTDRLSSPGDFNRIKNIKASLEESAQQAVRLQTTQIYKQAGLRSSKSLTKQGLKTYNIPTLQKDILIPDHLFELSREINEYYITQPAKTDIPQYKMDNGRFGLTVKKGG